MVLQQALRGPQTMGVVVGRVVLGHIVPGIMEVVVATFVLKSDATPVIIPDDVIAVILLLRPATLIMQPRKQM